MNDLKMGLSINTNSQSLFAQRALRINTDSLKVNIERLSTGYKINRAADDAAGLSISNKITTDLKGLEKALQNAGDGVSMIQTAEGGLEVIQENLQRMRELVIQGTSGTYGSVEKGAMQREINERVKIIFDITQATQFNGINLLTGTTDRVLQTGTINGQNSQIKFASGIDPYTGIDIDISEVADGGSTDYGHLIEGTSTGFALDRLYIPGSDIDSYNYATHTANVIASVSDIDVMIDNISRMRSYLGASQNALESKINFMDIARENSESSRSRIKDVDVAKESSVLIKNQILQQTASAMLSQANTIPQIALSLLPQ